MTTLHDMKRHKKGRKGIVFNTSVNDWDNMGNHK